MKIYIPGSADPKTGERQYITKSGESWVLKQEHHQDFDSHIQYLQDSFALDAMLQYFQQGFNNLTR